ncbi:hypothetical protein DdX_14986 [Ditylenchus destructor]|uniref:Uncharacterized protein n=1 Tax=Ditylenchus destructor TaxID=166010 RepID=A0AAD4MQ59_9BILA|nr:hypothetical protein DdX_14986 [Ditylenchus destructor]
MLRASKLDEEEVQLNLQEPTTADCETGCLWCPVDPSKKLNSRPTEYTRTGSDTKACQKERRKLAMGPLLK